MSKLIIFSFFLMGLTCSNKRIVNQEIHKKKTQLTSIKTSNEQENMNKKSIDEVLDLYKKFTAYLELIGNFDYLKPTTKQHIQELKNQQQNCEIIITNSLRRILRMKGIIRQPQPDDDILLVIDKKFSQSLEIQLKRTVEIIRLLEYDEDFQENFPLLSPAFQELANQI